ncbi:ribosome maturation factor RimM [Epidermidibacterium keratini]|uniref:Ribosome maturation factor RimM n=1 Tax=Epidermidibacterium keratini TaxID=1891644 RepID=A0A7L4YRI5_9ACTN|nr:ribosome maturation factor RimM [Epidermidibacterium keratini]QHC01845.1 ribosome maturation factor RimM [Epidermidibacterium keratini]
MELVIGRIGKAHGIRGELTVGMRTDEPEERFAPGTQIATDPAENGPLTVESVRFVGGKAVVAFEEVADRNAAEALRGTMLVIDTADLPEIDDEDEFYDHELVGMNVTLLDGSTLGTVTDVVHGPGADTLAIEYGDRELLVPFVRAIVPTIDRARRTMVIVPPDGLLEL